MYNVEYYDVVASRVWKCNICGEIITMDFDVIIKNHLQDVHKLERDELHLFDHDSSIEYRKNFKILKQRILNS